MKNALIFLFGLGIGFCVCFYGFTKTSVRFVWTEDHLAGFQKYSGIFKNGQPQVYWKAKTRAEQECIRRHFNNSLFNEALFDSKAYPEE